jgi:hypothetical protein
MTIYHKAMLSGACEIARVEKENPLVLLEPDGSIASICSWAIYASEPTHPGIIRSLPFGNDVPLETAVAVSVEQLTTLIKAIPSDRQFKSKLEHISIKTDGAYLSCEINGGKGVISQKIRSLKGSPMLLTWRDRLRALIAGNEASERSMTLKNYLFNRKRLMAAVCAIELACKYDGEFSYVAQSVVPNGYLWKALNELTGNQSVIIAHILPTGNIPPPSDWEKKIFAKEAKKIVLTKRSPIILKKKGT